MDSSDAFLVEENLRRFTAALVREFDQARRDQLRSLLLAEVRRSVKVAGAGRVLIDVTAEMSARIRAQEALITGLAASSDATASEMTVLAARLTLQNIRDAHQFLQETCKPAFAAGADRDRAAAAAGDDRSESDNRAHG